MGSLNEQIRQNRISNLTKFVKRKSSDKTLEQLKDILIELKKGKLGTDSITNLINLMNDQMILKSDEHILYQYALVHIMGYIANSSNMIYSVLINGQVMELSADAFLDFIKIGKNGRLEVNETALKQIQQKMSGNTDTDLDSVLKTLETEGSKLSDDQLFSGVRINQEATLFYKMLMKQGTDLGLIQKLGKNSKYQILGSDKTYNEGDIFENAQNIFYKLTAEQQGYFSNPSSLQQAQTLFGSILSTTEPLSFIKNFRHDSSSGTSSGDIQTTNMSQETQSMFKIMNQRTQFEIEVKVRDATIARGQLIPETFSLLQNYFKNFYDEKTMMITEQDQESILKILSASSQGRQALLTKFNDSNFFQQAGFSKQDIINNLFGQF